MKPVFKPSVKALLIAVLPGLGIWALIIWGLHRIWVAL